MRTLCVDYNHYYYINILLLRFQFNFGRNTISYFFCYKIWNHVTYLPIKLLGFFETFLFVLARIEWQQFSKKFHKNNRIRSKGKQVRNGHGHYNGSCQLHNMFKSNLVKLFHFFLLEQHYFMEFEFNPILYFFSFVVYKFNEP